MEAKAVMPHSHDQLKRGIRPLKRDQFTRSAYHLK
jgi:hypothetical protein